MNYSNKLVAKLSLLNVSVLVLSTALLAACGPSDEEKAAAEQQAQSKRVVKQVKPVDPLAGLASAVTGSKGTLPLDVRFELLDRPEPNKPATIRLVFVPTIDLYALHAVIKPFAGIHVPDNTQVKFDTPKKDELAEYKFAVTPTGTGIFMTNIEVTITRDTGDTVFIYSVPVAVPDPASASAPVASAAPSAK